MAFLPLRESAESEAARLAQAPEGSRFHALSTLPVTINDWPLDQLIELPWLDAGISDKRVVVVPIEFQPIQRPKTDADLHRRHSGSWDCIVVASEHESYPVGGFRLSIPTAELVRGTKANIAGMPSRNG